MRAALAAAEPEAVCHLAAQSSVRRSWEDPVGTTIVDAVGTLNLCTAAATLDGPPRILLVSSIRGLRERRTGGPAHKRGPAVRSG